MVRARSKALTPVVKPWRGVAVDGDHQGCTTDRGVAGGLGVQVEPVAGRLVQADEQVAPALADHEGHGLGRHELGGHDQVALVLSGLIIGEHDHAAGAELVEDLGDGAEAFGGLGRHGRG